MKILLKVFDRILSNTENDIESALVRVEEIEDEVEFYTNRYILRDYIELLKFNLNLAKAY